MKRCYQCEKENEDTQAFCGFCGAPMKLGDFLSKKVGDEVAAATRDRSLIETESSIRVFERAWGWFKLFLSVVTVAAAILSVGVFWKAFDLRSSVNGAKTAVQDTAASAERQIQASSGSSVQKINSAAQRATDASQIAAAEVSKQSGQAIRQTTQMSADLNKQAATVKTDIAHSRVELDAANQIRPQMLSMQQDLASAKSDIEEQKKAISSTEEFAKKVFSSRATVIANFPNASNDSVATGNGYVVVPRKVPNTGQSSVYILLPQEPIDETIEIKYRIFVQPRFSYIHFQNLIVFFWGDPAGYLSQQGGLEISYFPDTSEKNLIKAVSFHDGRVYADDQPMPKFNEADPDFKGNKWMRVGPSTPSLPPSQPQPKP